MKRPTKKPTVEINLAPAVAEMRENIAAHDTRIQEIERDSITDFDATCSRLDDLNERIGNLEASTSSDELLNDVEQLATQDMLVGLWVQEQRDAGVTNIDLSIVDHIRTGIALALR